MSLQKDKPENLILKQQPIILKLKAKLKKYINEKLRIEEEYSKRELRDKVEELKPNRESYTGWGWRVYGYNEYM